MRTFVPLGLAIAMLALPLEPAVACSFGKIPTPFSDVLAHSHNVAIVRVVASEWMKDEGGMAIIEAHVKRVETLRGTPYPIRTLRYMSGECLPLHFDAGDYLLLVTDNQSQSVLLDAFAENVVSMWGFGYLPPEAWTRGPDPSPTMARLRRAINGKAELPEAEILEGYKHNGATFNFVSDPSAQGRSKDKPKH